MLKLFEINVFARDEDTFTKNSAFSTKQMFKSREELFELIQNKARSLGYIKGINDFVYKVVLICDRGGEYKATNTVRASGTRKTNCKFEPEGKYSKEHNKWTLSVICDDHNHPPAQHMEGHPFIRRLSVDETRLVEDLTRKNLPPRDILSTLKGQNENNVSVIQTVYNAQQKIRRQEQAGKTPMQVLMSILHTNNYLYKFTTGDSNELENLFFVHPTSWKIWRAFPHVLMIDTTYKTNKYNKPLVEIVGVTSTRKTFSVGFAFIHREKEANYTWVLNCVKSILDNCMDPRVIITDRELALINEYETVWVSDIDGIHGKLPTTLINVHKLSTYIDDTWLNKYREMFVSVWSQEPTFKVKKKKLNSANSNLDKFVQRMNQVVQSQLTSVKESFENSLTIQRLGDLMLDSSNCGCKLRYSCGLPCACMLSFYSISGENIPLDSIDIFWRKFDISDMTSVADDDINCDDVVNKFKENFNKQSKAGKMFYRRKLEEIYDPQKADVGEPTIQKNTVKKQQKKKVNPPNHAHRRCNFSTTSEFNGGEFK
uniref:MULE transposase domain-containing protein n=1 Tax=Lactuca sativa TaxID=4236 RepID=A0A9R1VRZ2_LACSA|nr:hypothetical protein LSAT_V11C400197040 [Lactuca sativa]